MFTTENFIDCLDLLAEIYIAKYWHPRVKPVGFFSGETYWSLTMEEYSAS